LLLSSISLMHRSSTSSFAMSSKFLEQLIERHPRAAVPKAWLAKWHVLKQVHFPESSDRNDGLRALELTKRALDQDENSSLSLAIQGYVYNHMLEQPEKAMQCLAEAVAQRPSEPMAWLFRSVIEAMWGQASSAVEYAQKAVELSPLDPLSYFYQSIYASSALASGEYELAVRAAVQSIKHNQLHLPNYRVLLTAQFELGESEQAIETMSILRKLDPSFSLEKYQSAGNSQSRTRQQTIRALTALEKFTVS
jgi:adenylate cyclase